VFSRPRRLSPDTVTRVTEVARELGYEPRRYAGRRQTGLHVGYLQPRTEYIDLINDTWARAAAAMGLAAARQGHRYYAFGSNPEQPDGDIKVLKRELALGQLNAVVFTDPRYDDEDPRIQFLNERSVPFVVWGRQRETTGYNWVDDDDETAIADHVGRFIDLGHRVIAHLGFATQLDGLTGEGGVDDSGPPYRRAAGYRRAMARGRLTPVERVIAYDTLLDDDRTVATITDLLEERVQGERVTAVVADSDWYAIMVQSVMNRLRRPASDNVEVAGIDDMTVRRILPQPFASMRCDYLRLADRALWLLQRSLTDIRSVDHSLTRYELVEPPAAPQG